MLFDSHLHLTSGRFSDDRAEVLARARAADVSGMVTIASDPEDAADAVELAAQTPGVWATAGLHPHEAGRTSAAVMEEIERLSGAPEVVAIGETGLDFHYDNAPRALQVANFEAHLRLSSRLELPIVVHSRSAEAETAALVAEYGGSATGVLHCFSGGDKLLEAALEAGWHISFSGLVTFADEVAGAVRDIPADRLLIETDAPYLAPEGKRGRRNEPAFLAYTCARVAALRGVSFERVATTTAANARELYGLREPEGEPCPAE